MTQKIETTLQRFCSLVPGGKDCKLKVFQETEAYTRAGFNFFEPFFCI